MALEAVIFGIDGVLAETAEARRESFNQVFGEAGLDWRWGRTLYAQLLRSTGGEDMIREFVRARFPHWRETDDLAQLLSVMKRRQNSIFREQIESGAVKLRSSVERVLDAVAASRLRLAIATTERRAHVLSLLRANLGPDGPARFEVIVTPDDDEHPCSGVVRCHTLALRSLKLPADSCLAVESSSIGAGLAVAVGIRTAVTAGIYSQLLDYDHATIGLAPMSASSRRTLPCWDSAAPAEILEEMRNAHATPPRAGGVFVPRVSPTWSLSDMELNDAGFRHLEN